MGFYDPSGKWHPESDYDKREEAAKRVHYLNGTKHTRLPWFAEAGGRKIYSGPDYDVVVCDVHDWEESEGRANAEFIVRACNSHYELVRALGCVIHHNNAIKSQFKLPDSLIEQVESTLNEATGQSQNWRRAND